MAKPVNTEAAPASTTEAVATAVETVIKDRPMLQLGNLKDGFYTDNHQLVIAGQVHFVGREIVPSRIQKAVGKGILNAAVNKATDVISGEEAIAAAREAILFGYRVIAACTPAMSISLRGQKDKTVESAIRALRDNLDSKC